MINAKIQNIFINDKNNFYKFICYSVYFLIGASLSFGRPFVGVYFFGFRLGELLILFAFLISILLSILFFDGFSEIFNEKKVFSFLVVSFFVVSLITSTNLFDPYAYRASSYIWTLSYLFVGYYFVSKEIINKYVLSLIFLVPIFTYIISTGNYPNFIMSFFNEFSDKFQFLKGSDLALSFIASTFFIKNLNFNSKLKFSFFVFMAYLYIPLLLFSSRGAFISAMLYIILELIFYKKFISKNVIFSILVFTVGVLIFLFSSYRVEGSASFEEITDPESVTATIESIASQKKTKDLFLGFYINGDGYLDSWDPTTSWRLDIWQDLYYYMIDEKIIFFGHGYKEIFPIMLDPTAPGRLGRDGLNENVHNFVMNILGRGGAFQLLIYLMFQSFLIYKYFLKFKNLKILNFVLPLFLISLFDATMESVHFPIILFTFYGFFLRNGCRETLDKY